MRLPCNLQLSCWQRLLGKDVASSDYRDEVLCPLDLELEALPDLSLSQGKRCSSLVDRCGVCNVEGNHFGDVEGCLAKVEGGVVVMIWIAS